MNHPLVSCGEGAELRPAHEPMELSAGFRAGLSARGIDLGEEVGRGAMSVVYRATDRRHSRPVAVKILQPGATAACDTDRFLREIQFAAGLQHPHILPVYSSGTVDGTLYYVMPYVEGESLRARLARSGRLPVAEAIRIAQEVADALDYAHARGVIHRDIKPENILLEAGHAVVADFGVAMLLPRADQESDGDPAGRLTGGGLVVGTPSYMSPEQATGEAEIDGRSDLFGLACVLYEMLAGEPPFSGPSARAIIARRFQGAPAPVRARRPDVPLGVEVAIERALEVDPAARFATGAEFSAALAAAERRAGWRRPALALLAGALGVALLSVGAGAIPHRRSHHLNPMRVAVAALSNETGDTTLAPLGPMVASWITDRLGATRDVVVVTSAIVVPAQHDRHFADSALDDPERLQRLAAETRAGTLVSGSYYRGTGGRVELHVEISDANSGRLLRAIGPVTSTGDPEAAAATLSDAVAAAVDSVVSRPAGAALDGRFRYRNGNGTR